MGYNSSYALSDVECYIHAVPSIQEPLLVIARQEITYVCKSCFYGVHPHGGNERSDCKVTVVTEDEQWSGQCCCTWRKTKEVL